MITILLEKILAALTQLLGDIKTKLNTIKNNLDNLIVVATATGSIASFTTTLTRPLLSCIVDVPESVSGTDTVIVTQTGKNMFDKTKIKIAANRYMKYGVDNYSDSVPNGSLKLNGNTKYTISISAQAEGIAVYDKTGTQISVSYNTTSLTFTPSNSGAYFIYIYISSQTWSGSWDDYNIQLEVGNQATTYEPYSATTKTVSLPETVYGGEVDILDLIKPDVITAKNGVNNIFSDSGDITVEYLKLYKEV